MDRDNPFNRPPPFNRHRGGRGGGRPFNKSPRPYNNYRGRGGHHHNDNRIPPHEYRNDHFPQQEQQDVPSTRPAFPDQNQPGKFRENPGETDLAAALAQALQNPGVKNAYAPTLKPDLDAVQTALKDQVQEQFEKAEAALKVQMQELFKKAEAALKVQMQNQFEQAEAALKGQVSKQAQGSGPQYSTPPNYAGLSNQFQLNGALNPFHLGPFNMTQSANPCDMLPAPANSFAFGQGPMKLGSQVTPASSFDFGLPSGLPSGPPVGPPGGPSGGPPGKLPSLESKAAHSLPSRKLNPHTQHIIDTSVFKTKNGHQISCAKDDDIPACSAPPTEVTAFALRCVVVAASGKQDSSSSMGAKLTKYLANHSLREKPVNIIQFHDKSSDSKSTSAWSKFKGTSKEEDHGQGVGFAIALWGEKLTNGRDCSDCHDKSPLLDGCYVLPELDPMYGPMLSCANYWLVNRRYECSIYKAWLKNQDGPLKDPVRQPHRTSRKRVSSSGNGSDPREPESDSSTAPLSAGAAKRAKRSGDGENSA